MNKKNSILANWIHLTQQGSMYIYIIIFNNIYIYILYKYNKYETALFFCHNNCTHHETTGNSIALIRNFLCVFLSIFFLSRKLHNIYIYVKCHTIHLQSETLYIWKGSYNIAAKWRQKKKIKKFFHYIQVLPRNSGA